MKPCLQHLVNCPINESINLEKPMVVQIIGHRYYHNPLTNQRQTIYSISDGKNFCTAFILPQLDDYKLFQMIEFKNITAIIYQGNIKKCPILILRKISLISNEEEEVIGSPLIINTSMPIQSYKVLMQNQDQNSQLTSSSNQSSNLKLSYKPPIIARIVNIYLGQNKPLIVIVPKNNSGTQTEGALIHGSDDFLNNLELYKVYEISNYDYNFRNISKKYTYPYIFTNTTVFRPIQDDYEVDFDREMNTFKDFENISIRYSKFWAIIADIGKLHHFADGSFSRIVLLADKTERTIQLELTNSHALSIQESDEEKVIFAYKAWISVNKGVKRLILDDKSIVKLFDRSNNNSKANDLLDWYIEKRDFVGQFKHLSTKRYIHLDQIDTEKIGFDSYECFCVDARLEQIEVNGVFLKFNKRKLKNEHFVFNNSDYTASSGYTMPKNEYFGHNHDGNYTGDYDEDEEEEEEDCEYINKTDRAEKYTLYYMTRDDDELLNKIEEEEGENLSKKEENAKNEIKKRAVFQFDLAFSDETVDRMFFRLSAFDQGIAEMIMGMTANKWKEETDSLTKPEKRDLIEPLLHDWYHLEVEAYREKKKNFNYKYKYKFPLLRITSMFPILHE